MDKNPSQGHGVFDEYAHFYDLLYRDKDYRGEAAFVHQKLTGAGGVIGSLLELGCGTGRHAVEFCGLGYHVAGVDLSEGMVEQAKARAQSVRSIPSDQMSFQSGDIRSVRLGRTFDSVVSLFHVMNYQNSNEDLRRAIETAATHVRPGGVFLFDFWYGPAVLSDPPVVRIKRLQDSKLEAIRIAEPEVRANDNLVIVNYQLLLRQVGNTAVREIREAHSMRYLFCPEMRDLLIDAGFQDIEFGAWMSSKGLGLDTWFGWCCAKRRDDF